MKKLAHLQHDLEERERKITLFEGTSNKVEITLVTPKPVDVLSLWQEVAEKKFEKENEHVVYMLTKSVQLCLPEEELTDEQAARLLVKTGGLVGALASNAGELTGIYGGLGAERPDPLDSGSRKPRAKRSKK